MVLHVGSSADMECSTQHFNTFQKPENTTEYAIKRPKGSIFLSNYKLFSLKVCPEHKLRTFLTAAIYWTKSMVSCSMLRTTFIYADWKFIKHDFLKI